MKKIRVIIAHSDVKVRNILINYIQELKYIDIVGITTNGIETYNKIVELKPDVVFSKYGYNNMTGLELLSKIKEKLQDNFPSFNTIGEIPDNELIDAIKITGSKINAFIKYPYNNVKDILNNYRKYNNKEISVY